jgi:two-component system sensor histidine kinase DesK
MRLLPKNQLHGWAPLTWLAYCGFFYIQPITDHAGWREWTLTGLGQVIFLVLYFRWFWVSRRQQLVIIALLVLLGAAYIPYNGGAGAFVVYAAAFVPFAFEKEKTAAGVLALVPVIPFLEIVLLHLSYWSIIYCCLLPLVVGGSNVFFAARNRMYEKLRMANDEITHLAKVAERERIARDLHDVLGHTLSVIILKSELAGKLIERDPARAKTEIADVEKTSRDALAEVRSTIRGYRLNSLRGELKQAESTLRTAGMTVEAETADMPLTPSQEGVLALVLREAVTNVVRHSGAHNCQIRLANANRKCSLEICDDGRGGLGREGNGIRGMRERVEALGGTLQYSSNAGTKLTIQFPLTLPGNNGDYERGIEGQSQDHPSCHR